MLLSYFNTQAQNIPAGIPAAKVPAPSWHYQEEYTFDSSINPSAWKNINTGLHVSFVSTDELYMRTEVPELKSNNMVWNETGWKGERLNTQILIWSADTLQQVRVTPDDLKASDGKTIKKENIQTNLIRYVISNYPYGAKNSTCDFTPYKNVYLMPDRFEYFDRFDLPGRTVRPVWLSVNLPQTISAGSYSGSVQITSGNYTKSLKINIVVQNQQLPHPKQWKHRLDIWQNPWVVAWRNKVEPWSAEHMLLLKRHLQLYADAGGTYITTYAVHSPWTDNSYMIEGGMIEWIKQKNNTWKFDYTIFDKYVDLCMSLGINEAITIYSPVPWGSRFRYFNEQTGNYVYENWPPNSKEFTGNWHIFLTDLKKHLQQKGWFSKTYIGINENPMDVTMAAIRMVKRHSKEWKITYAGDYHKELEYLLDDYCYLYGKESDVATVERRSAKGFTTTWYVCCNPPMPNNFVFSPPIEGRWMGWYSTAHKYDGFLRWAYDAWPADPDRDARHTLWPAGDCFMIYPGGNSCIRFEKLREGIVDFEKIRILKEKAANTNDTKENALVKELDEHLKVFLNEKEFETKKIIQDVNKGKGLVNKLSEAL